jgi:hypothetical protein
MPVRIPARNGDASFHGYDGAVLNRDYFLVKSMAYEWFFDGNKLGLFQ